MEDAENFFFLCCCSTLSGRKGRGKPAAAHCFGRKPDAFFRLNMRKAQPGYGWAFEIGALRNAQEKSVQGQQVQGVKDVKAPGDRFAPCALLTGIEGDGDHGQGPEELDGDGQAEYPNIGAGHDPVDQHHSDGLNPFSTGKLPGQGKQGHQQNAVSPIAQVQRICNEIAWHDQQNLPHRLLHPAHALHHNRAQKQQPQHILVRPGASAAVEDEIVDRFGDHRHNAQPQEVPPGASGVGDSLGDQEAVNGKCQPPDHPQPHGQPKHHRRMIDQHGHAGNKLQLLLAKGTLLFHASSLLLRPLYQPPSQNANPKEISIAFSREILYNVSRIRV